MSVSSPWSRPLLAALLVFSSLFTSPVRAAAAAVAAPDPLAIVRLPEAGTRGDVGTGFPRAANRLRTTGDVRFKVIFVDFSDAAATRTPPAVFDLISPGAERLYSALSYGRMKVILDPFLRWLRMKRPSGDYGWKGGLSFAHHRAYIQEALDLAQTAGADFSTSDAFIVLANPDALNLHNGPAFTPRPGSGVTVGGRTFENGATSGHDLLYWGYKWFNHEVGHTMGLADLYAFSGAGHRFVGDFSLMGLISGTAPEYFAWERWRLGWLDDTQVVAAPHGSSTTTLTPLETPGGLKLILIPTAKPTAVIAVENRRPLGFDAKLAQPGPLAYVIDTSNNSGEGPIQVLPVSDTDHRHLAAPQLVGQTLTFLGVTIKCLSLAGDDVTIEVIRP